jgi:hypothetical protein
MSMKIRRVHRPAPWLALGFALAGMAAWAADSIRTERVRFAKGASSATVEGTIRGDQVVDYVLGAAKGQSMNVSLATQHTATYFNLLAPGENEVAFFNGSVNGNRYEGTLPATGDYKVRVYMMRSAARRNENASYRLEMVISGKPQPAATARAAAQPATAATPTPRAKVDGFDATGPVPCARRAGQPMGQCVFGVRREGGGNASVEIKHPDGFRRTIYFARGKATGADTSQADGDVPFSAQRESDLNLIRVGDERYEIPDAVVAGG